MATLSANINATQTVIPVSGAAPATDTYWTVGTENVRFLGTSRGPQGRSFLRSYWSVDRGIAGTTKATHLSGATLTQYYPDAASSGGSNVPDPTGAPDGQVPTTDTGVYSLTTLPKDFYAQDDDPGAVGSGSVWKDTTDPDPAAALWWTRNAANDGWAPVMRIAVEGGDGAAAQLSALGHGATGSTIAGSAVSDGGGPANAGHSATVTGVGDATVSHGANADTGSAVIDFVASRFPSDAVLRLRIDDTGVVHFLTMGIPTADPAIAGELYTDGAPSAGVPKALMVSGG